MSLDDLDRVYGTAPRLRKADVLARWRDHLERAHRGEKPPLRVLIYRRDGRVDVEDLK
jgi:hypothetical protein